MLRCDLLEDRWTYRYPGLVHTDLVTDAHVDFDRVFGGFVGELFSPAPDGDGIIVWPGAKQREFAPTGNPLRELVEWPRGYDGPIGRRDATTG